MDPEIKRQWVEALRSGKYEQGRLFLERDGKFCCLGVLCHAVRGVTPTYNPDGGLSCYAENAGYGLVEELFPDTVAHETLWGMNDDQNKSFAEIADYIERTL